MRLRLPAGGAMTLRRLHAPRLPDRGGPVTLDESASRHVRVLRLQPGDEVELFDGHGRAASARIESIEPPVACAAGAPTEVATKSNRLVLMLGIPKGQTLDECVRMATELGVDHIALLQARRSVPRWDSKRADARVERLTRIAVEAATQCERLDLPDITGPKSLETWLQEIPDAATRVAFGARASDPLKLFGTHEQVWCAVGPEGGFSDEELESFVAAGFVVATLGDSILRVDTAVVSALTLVQDRLRSSQAR